MLYQAWDLRHVSTIFPIFDLEIPSYTNTEFRPLWGFQSPGAPEHPFSVRSWLKTLRPENRIMLFVVLEPAMTSSDVQQGCREICPLAAEDHPVARKRSNAITMST